MARKKPSVPSKTSKKKVSEREVKRLVALALDFVADRSASSLVGGTVSFYGHYCSGEQQAARAARRDRKDG